ncbi:hypothetical protein BB561_003665 [Smittium simulii]|uniref:Phospholipid/glycerol acyltransferase domain-containing protein n=1 Tax=Smittium simulii TaxID=133385 RepID=A0A2T9YK64_9FUNG|nr:hypothetical protein BB561_003665 [Smittium simulii]
MEKYSKWRDFGTGIQPFLPLTPPNIRKTAVNKIKDLIVVYFAGVAFSITRLLIISAIFSLDIAFLNLLYFLAPTKYIFNSIQTAIRRVTASLVLFISGFYQITQNVYSVKKIKQSKHKAVEKSKVPKSGDLILSNHSSYIDVLYFISKYNPVFVEIDNATLYMKPLKGWSAIASSCSKPTALLNAKHAQSLKSICEEARNYNLGPVVIFPENTTTNGQALLQLLPIFSNFENIDEKSNIFITSIKYPSKEFSPTFPMGNPFSHFFWLNSRFYNQIIVTNVDAADCPKFFYDSSSKSGNAVSPALDNINIDKEINSTLISCSKLRQTKLTALDKLEFLNYYQNKSKQYK